MPSVVKADAIDREPHCRRAPAGHVPFRKLIIG